jgi:gas vesicle protein GvpO
MAEGTRSSSRQRRSDAREKRRALAAKPFEELDEAAGAEESAGGARGALKQAAATAVAGALAAGVAGAAKALADRREQAEPESPEPDQDASEEADTEPQAQVEEAQPEEPERDAQPQAAAEQEQEDNQPEERDGDGENGTRGTPMNDAKEIVAEAKRELQELLGAEVESVSGFERSDGQWTVMLEVVNLRRIPDTTDVLSSYAVVFDDDRNLVSISETRRYRRSQVEEG